MNILFQRPNSEPNNADEIATAIRTHSYLVIEPNAWNFTDFAA
jgi:hypothetical protein